MILVEVWCFLGLLSWISCLQLKADERELRKLLIKELSPRFADQEVTVTFWSLGTNGISQEFKEGETSTFALEPVQSDDRKKLRVWIGGDLAEIVDRFGFGHGVPRIPPGTKIEVTGKFKYHKSDGVEHYFLQVDDWKRFRILNYPSIKKENSLPIAPQNTKQR